MHVRRALLSSYNPPAPTLAPTTWLEQCMVGSRRGGGRRKQPKGMTEVGRSEEGAGGGCGVRPVWLGGEREGAGGFLPPPTEEAAGEMTGAGGEMVRPLPEAGGEAISSSGAVCSLLYTFFAQLGLLLLPACLPAGWLAYSRNQILICSRWKSKRPGSGQKKLAESERLGSGPVLARC